MGGETPLGDLPVGHEGEHVVAGTVRAPGLGQRDVGQGPGVRHLADEDVDQLGAVRLGPVQQGERAGLGAEDLVEQRAVGRPLGAVAGHDRASLAVVTTAQRAAAYSRAIRCWLSVKSATASAITNVSMSWLNASTAVMSTPTWA